MSHKNLPKHTQLAHQEHVHCYYSDGERQCMQICLLHVIKVVIDWFVCGM